jgi:glycosyltransferase involved in cell wall biosynthesis
MRTELVPRRSLTFISDLELTRAGGGAYAVNWHAVNELRKHFDVSYAGPIVPVTPWIEKTESKIRRRIFGSRGRFAYFSPATLDRNARLAHEAFEKAGDAAVFRSATRWCRCRPRVPYFVYLDVVFHTFFFNTFSENSFDRADLQRIWKEEAAFLEGATGVFFESAWGMEKARDAYGLRGTHYHAVGRGGVVDPPTEDAWSGSHELVTIAMNFEQKGGDIVLDAYRALKPRFPSLSWRIVGGQPCSGFDSLNGVTYEGELNVEVEADLERLRQILSGAFLLVHPTREDTSPLVVTEAAYFGCPSLSVRAFAIPELVDDGVTGLLVDFPARSVDIANGIATLMDDPARYQEMRARTRGESLARHSWPAIGEMISAKILESL